jgi:hypothetical protein
MKIVLPYWVMREVKRQAKQFAAVLCYPPDCGMNAAFLPPYKVLREGEGKLTIRNEKEK